MSKQLYKSVFKESQKIPLKAVIEALIVTVVYENGMKTKTQTWFIENKKCMIFYQITYKVDLF